VTKQRKEQNRELVNDAKALFEQNLPTIKVRSILVQYNGISNARANDACKRARKELNIYRPKRQST
jgi:hypothetical protein